jgi:hypothetical protein
MEESIPTIVEEPKKSKKKPKKKKNIANEKWNLFQKWATDNKINVEHADLAEFVETGR